MIQQYKIDSNDKEILLRDNEFQVMMEWEKPYMEACIDELKPKGNVLEIGFGMGYSATQIQRHKPKSHTIIEMDPVVIKRLKKWSKNYNNINIIEGTWQEQIHNLGEFDEIFFDDYPLQKPDTILEKKLMTERFFMFLDICLYSHTNENAKFSAYIYNPSGTFKQRMTEHRMINYYEKYIDISVPDNCNYFKGNKAIIPIITKIN